MSSETLTSSSSDCLVITGLGAVTPLGVGVETFWQNLVAGRHGFRTIRTFDPAAHRTQVAAEVSTLPEFGPRRLNRKLLSRNDLMQLVAVREALTQARLYDQAAGTGINPAMGIISATAAGGILGLEQFFSHRFNRRPCDPAPLLTSFCLSAAATNVAKEFLLNGPRATTATVCSSSGLAMAMALELLRMGEVEQVLVIASESLCEVTHAGFNSLRSIAPEVCRPFDQNRQGLILGEGAGAMVLETLHSAEKRSAQVLAAFEGYGLTTDLHHFTAPAPHGGAIADTIKSALADSGLTADRIDYINAHGTGTPLNDAAECQGIMTVFGAAARKISLSSSKSMFGHTLGAASLLEAIATIKAMRDGMVPPTINISAPDPECPLDITPNVAGKRKTATAVSNSFAFGGSNISIVLSRSAGENHRIYPRTGQKTPVITGIGLVGPYGVGKEALTAGVASGRGALSSFAEIGRDWAAFTGGLVDLAAVREKIPAKRRRHLNRLGSFLTVSTLAALEDAGLLDDDFDNYTMAYGSAYGCSSNVHNFYTQLLAKGPTVASPQEFMLSVTNAPAALVAQSLGIQGPLWVFVADEASWDITLHWSARLIAFGLADKVIVAAADEISESILAIHHGLGFMNKSGPENLTLGEGAVTMVLETEHAAQKRRANIYGKLTGWATTRDNACGPMDFSGSEKLMNAAVEQCLRTEQAAISSLCSIGPENHWPVVDALAQKTFEYLQQKAFPVDRLQYRGLFGESGATGGLALAATLLCKNDRPCSHSLIQTASRGGIQAATLVQTSRST